MFHLPPFISLSLSVSLTKLSKFSQTLPPFLAGSAASACIGCYCTQSTKYSLQQRLAYSGHSTTIQQVQRRHELTRGSPQQEPNSYNCSSGRSKHAAQIRLSANVKLLNASHMSDVNNGRSVTATTNERPLRAADGDARLWSTFSP